MTRLPRYVIRLLELQRVGRISTDRIADISVRHDHDCQRLSRLGCRSCDPDVTVMPAPPKGWERAA